MRGMVSLALGVVTATVAFGQGQVNDGPMIFAHNSFHAPDVGADTADFQFGTAGVDHLFQTWWWFRLAGEGMETQLRDPDTQSYTGSVATLGWTNADGAGKFNATLTSTVDYTDLCEGTLSQTLAITNTSGALLNLSLFSYLDLDLTATPFDDTASLLIANVEVAAADADTDVVIEGQSASALQVGDAQNPSVSLRTILADGIADTLDGSGLPFVPPATDFEIAFQWQALSLGVGASTSVTQSWALSYPPFCDQAKIFADGFESGATSAWSSAVP